MISKIIRDAIFFRKDELCLNGHDFSLGFDDELRMLLTEATDKSVTILRLNNCKLQSLQSFPVLRKLQRLELADNPLSVKDLEQLMEFESLISLNLNRVAVASVNDLRPLRRLPRLAQLELEDVKVTEQSEFRTLLVDMLPRLQYLNSQSLDHKSKSLLEQLNMKTY